MFVNTDEGRAILEGAINTQDEVIGVVPVVQPTDYALLKLMAIANNSDRKARDMADLEILFKSAAAGFLHPAFKPINIDHLQIFAARFHVLESLAALLPLIVDANKNSPQEIEKQNG